MRARVLATALLTGGLVLAGPLAASAHVHVDPDRAQPGSSASLSFSVPNESDAATTTAVRIAVPAALGAVTPESVPGWRLVSSAGAVTWTATGAGVGVGATQRFVLRVASVPDTGRIELPTRQTYSDGRIVDWDESTPASGEEPEHPAPTLYVRDAAPAEDDDADADAAAPVVAADPLPLALAVGAAVVAVGALVVALLALLRRR